MKIVKIDRRQKPQAGAKGRKFKPFGMHKKSYKPIIKWIEEMGFEFVSQKNHAIWKHPERKCSSISIATTPTDRNYVQGLVNKIRKVCENCNPPIFIDKLPASISKLRLVGKMDGGEKELTMGDLLDSYVVDYQRVSTEMTADGKQELKSLAETKGITMGEMIEEMMIVYKDKQ